MSERRELSDGTGRTALVNGSIVGGYTVEYLASGGMSCVYKARSDGRVVVLKEVAASNTREVPSLISEKGLLERLKHPAVVGFYSFFNEGGYYYLVLEYVPGEPLSAYLSPNNRPSPEQVAEWGVQLCEVFDYLHNQNPPVIYRDLKAENILLDNGKIRLIDFGIARIHKGVRQKDTELMGSPATASPEHYGGAETDARSDIYTLGATLYELLSGGKRKQLGAFQFAPIRELNDQVSPELEQILIKATHFKPTERFQTTLEMRDALLKALGKPIPQAPSDELHTQAFSPSSIPPEPTKKTRSPLIFLVILLLLGVVGLYGYNKYEETQSPFYGGPVKSMGTFEQNLTADIFTSGDVDGQAAVLLGEDIGLFQVTPWKEADGPMRAKVLAKRLNSMYHSACISCGGTGLEPKDIKVGRHVETGQVVVFYAHMHGNHVHWGPELLATVDDTQAESMGVTPRFVASYWRDLVRDTINLSRGFDVHDSVMGPELSAALLKARAKLAQSTEQLTNLRAIVAEVSGQESLKLRDLFLSVPDRKPDPDSFEQVEGYEPLTL
jgi:serine/threonine protein kinase